MASRMYTCITTYDLIRPTRAVYGATNIPAISQRKMESILTDILNVISFVDNILMHAENFEQVLTSLQTILSRLKRQGLRLNRYKCVF